MFFTIWFRIETWAGYFSIQNIKSNCYIISLIFFSIVFLWWENYFFSVILIYKSLNFCYSLWIFLISSWFNVAVTLYWKHLLSSLLMGFIFAFLFFIQIGESIYDPQRFGFLLLHLQHNKWNEISIQIIIRDKLPTFHRF